MFGETHAGNVSKPAACRKQIDYWALATELGGVQVYTTALHCVVNDELKAEWEEYLDQTRNHAQIVQDVIEQLGLDPQTETPGRKVTQYVSFRIFWHIVLDFSSRNLCALCGS